MAKESMKAKQRKKIKMADQYAEKRAALRKAANEGDWDAMMALQKLPKNSMKIRVHNRCGLTGRPRGYMRQFGISRVTFREMALAGKIPGVTKASW
ncbi:30S ribosomal protein S14 [Crocinitomix algicola]|uniref:30S ribosomal protein S14 n=1 Tax=Crocinitomix algicola TaxID=1740263 RepID=UPI0008296364|nr:30S ribosomal protein S14 [Crocinitomix algicola]